MSDEQNRDVPEPGPGGSDPAAARPGTPSWPSDDGWSTGPAQPPPGASGPPAPAPPGWGAPPSYGGGPPAAPGWGDAPSRGGPGWSGPGAAGPRNTVGTVALVLGIIGLLLFWTTLPGLALGVTAIVLGAVGRARARRGEATNGGVALAGLVTGIVASVLSVVLLALAITFVATHKDTFSHYTDCTNQATTDSQRSHCDQQLYDDLFR